MKHFVLGTIVSTLIFALVVGAYFFGKKEISSTPPSPTPETVNEIVLSTPIPSNPIVATESAQPAQNPQSAITLAVSSKTYSDLESLMTESVSVRIESSGCCEPQTPQGATTQLKYLDAATAPWIFSATDPVVLQLAAKSPQYWGSDKIVGISANKYAVAFGTNTLGKIDSISMVVNYDLILNQ